MAFDGYLEFSGTEIANVARTLRYVQHEAPGLAIESKLPVPEGLHAAVGDEPYESPLVDDAPWFDPAVPATSEFFGLYPLEVQGLTDSTLTAEVTERIDDGGSVGTQREGSKSVRVRGLLVGRSEVGVAAGMTWLRNVLRTNECLGPSPCGGADLRFFLAEPKVVPAAFGPETIGHLSEQFGTLLEGGITSHRWTVEEAHPLMPAEVSWTGAFSEGSGFLYGAKERVGDTTIAAEGPVFPFRRNYVPNPSMRTGLVGYAAGSSSQVSWILEGGADRAGYARVSAPGSGVVTDDPNATGSVFGGGVFGEGVFGGAPGAVSSDLRLISTSVLPVPAGLVSFSVSIRAASSTTVMVEIRDGGTSAVLASASDFSVGDWKRTGVTATAGSNGVQLVISANGDFDVDMLLLERGGTILDYFDGTSQIEGATASWEGTVDNSVSLLKMDSLDFCWPNSDFRPFLQSVQGTADQVRLTWQLRRTITMEEQLLGVDRSLHGAVCTQGPAVISEIKNKEGWFTEIDFVIAAEQPGLYAPPVAVSTVPVSTSAFTDPAVPLQLEDEWLYDPAGPAPTPAPTAPTVVPDNAPVLSGDWLRYYVEIPADDVALGAKTVPTIGITTHERVAEGIRVRFHPNPFGYEAERVDPLSYCAELIVSYLPPGTRLVLNGMTRQAVASKPGFATVSAGHLLYGSAGAPVAWPDLTCGVSYLMTVDVPAGSASDDFEIDLTVARRE